MPATLDLGNILGGITQAETVLQDELSLRKFLKTVDKYGLQTDNNFEVNFSGIPKFTFFIQSIQMPGVKQNTTSLYFDGREVFVPVNHEYEHDWSMEVLNDAQGYIYTALAEFAATDATNRLVNSGYTLTVKCLTGDKKHYPGALITARGVRITSVGGLGYAYGGGNVQRFTVSGKLIDFSYTPGKLAKAAGVIGAVTSIIG